MAGASSSAGDSNPGVGSPSELRRSVGQATQRIHEIIDAAERVAIEIRTDAESEAEGYLAERKREADRLAADRSEALDQLTGMLADSAERFKQQAEQMLLDLDLVIAEARAGVARNGLSAAPEPEPEPPPAAPVEPPRPRVGVFAYPGTTAKTPEPEAPVQGNGDQDAEALLRATQMAVTGKSRDEIAAVLQADFPGVDSEAILDEILG